jgi:alanine racemase
MIPAVEARISLAALKYNLTCVRRAAPQSKVMAVIKADGYGHGMIEVGRALEGADAFAVARLDEALALREAGITKPVAVLEGYDSSAELDTFVQHDLQPVIHRVGQIDLIEQAGLASPLQLWLKVDSGMHRLGVPAESAKQYWQRLEKIAAVSLVRIMTHLASADDRRSPQTEQQLSTFNEAIADIESETSIANSAAVLGWPQSHREWVRPGIMLYGVSPFLGGWGEDFGLEPVMCLSSRLIAVNYFKKGDAIGYGASWVCPEDMPVGVVACGYGDGYPRHAVPGTPLLLNGKRVPLVGRVSMDSICVDLRQQPDAKVGDAVLLWGSKELPVEEIAQGASTIPYELLCSVTQRVKFNYD